MDIRVVPELGTKGIEMRYGDVVNLAWDVADSVAPVLTRSKRTSVFAALGAGAPNDVLASLLHEGVHREVSLEPLLAARVLAWVDGYADPRDRPTLRLQLKRI